jgi:hypothetical protein
MTQEEFMTVFRTAITAAAILASIVSAGCTTTGTATPPAAGPSASTPANTAPAANGAPGAGGTPGATPPVPGTRPPGAAPAAPPVAGAPRPFAEIIKDAKQTAGFLTLWQKDEKTWIELTPDQFDKPMFLAVSLSRGLGEKRFFGGLMGLEGYTPGGAHVIEFRKAGGLVQMIARNTTFFAQAGTPEERALKNAFSDSLLGAAPPASAPHPERKSILVEVNALMTGDIPRAGSFLELAYRNNFALDPRNTSIKSAKTDAQRTVIDIQAHFSQARIPVPPPPAPQPQPGATPPPFYPPPDVIPDPRSLFLGFLYTFSALPAEPMAPRLADARVGYFASPRVTFSDESRFSPVRHNIIRWRLEKKDPKAAVSDPVKPITFWLSNEIPEKYRGPIRDGILEWNKAYERIGISNAIVVKQQPDNSDIDLGETGYSSVRWFTTARPSFGAIGPSQWDPRTGEILDADIGWDANVVRNLRFQRSESIAFGHYEPMFDEHSGELRPQAFGLGVPGSRRNTCGYVEHAAREAGFALALLEARGEVEPGSPETEAFVAAFLKDISMHEVGHTLGLRHNFRASTVNSLAQLADPAHTQKNGMTGSVMEYSPANIALQKEKQGQYFTSTLGAYDYWAIEFGYKPVAPADEAAELNRIASRSNEPQLAFGTDEEAGVGIDPFVNTFDLGNDPLAYYRKRMQLTRELWTRLESRQLKAGEPYNVLRRRFLTGLGQMTQTMGLAAKYVGGSETVADQAGSPRLPVTPMPPARQREALAIVTDGLLRSESFQVSPNFMRKLVMDRLEREEIADPAMAMGTYELNLPDRVLAIQRDVLNRLMSPTVAKRILASRTQVANAQDAFSLSELYGTLLRAVWDEARRGAEADALRRNLQREHLRRVVGGLLGSSAAYPADARALLRQDARQLLGWLQAAVKQGKLSAETRAHYSEAAESLSEALKAPLVRQGV